MMTYFSQKEFEMFSTGKAGHLRLEWLALTGRVFTPRENEEISRRLKDFFHTYRHEKTTGRQILETFWEEDR
jgi:hypothetical protein